MDVLAGGDASDEARRELWRAWEEVRHADMGYRVVEGSWTEAEYLLLSAQTNTLVEYTDGAIELLPMPYASHQLSVGHIFAALHARMREAGGTAIFAPLPLRLREGLFREPDILLLLDEHDPRQQSKGWFGADMVVEIVSPGGEERDTVEKVRDYAEARIPEYWIVDPQAETIAVLALEGEAYVSHGIFGRGERASGRVLTGFEVIVGEALDAR